MKFFGRWFLALSALAFATGFVARFVVSEWDDVKAKIDNNSRHIDKIEEKFGFKVKHDTKPMTNSKSCSCPTTRCTCKPDTCHCSSCPLHYNTTTKEKKAREAYERAYEDAQRRLDDGELAYPALEASAAYRKALESYKEVP